MLALHLIYKDGNVKLEQEMIIIKIIDTLWHSSLFV